MNYKKLKNKFKKIAEKQDFYFAEREDSFEIQDVYVYNYGVVSFDDGCRCYTLGKTDNFNYINDLIVAILMIRGE